MTLACVRWCAQGAEEKKRQQDEDEDITTDFLFRNKEKLTVLFRQFDTNSSGTLRVSGFICSPPLAGCVRLAAGPVGALPRALVTTRCEFGMTDSLSNLSLAVPLVRHWLTMLLPGCCVVFQVT